MENTDKIIDIFGELTTNYKHLMSKLEDKRIQELKNKCVSDFKALKNDMAQLFLSDDPEKDMVNIEEKHRKVYYENHFAVDSFFNKDSKNYEEKYNKLMKQYSELSKQVKGASIIYEKCSENCIEKYKQESTLILNLACRLKEFEDQSIVVEIPSDEMKFLDSIDDYRDISYLYDKQRGIVKSSLIINELVIKKMKEYNIELIYLTCIEGSYGQNGLKLDYKIHTINSMLKQYPFLKKKIDETFHIIVNGKIRIHTLKHRENRSILHDNFELFELYIKKEFGNDIFMSGNCTITRFL